MKLSFETAWLYSSSVIAASRVRGHTARNDRGHHSRHQATTEALDGYAHLCIFVGMVYLDGTGMTGFDGGGWSQVASREAPNPKTQRKL